jgi:hypothetical protein
MIADFRFAFTGYLGKDKKEFKIYLKKSERILFEVVNQLLELTKDVEIPDDITGVKMELGLTIWHPAYLWVVQLNDQGFREIDYPFNTEYFQAMRPLGSFLHKLRNVCYQALRVIDLLNFPFTIYKNSNYWWRDIVAEIEAGYLNSNNKTLALFKAENDKRNIRNWVREEANLLIKGENPFDTNETPNLEFFARVCIEISIHQSTDKKIIKKAKKELRDDWRDCWNLYKDIEASWRESQILIRARATDQETIEKVISGKKMEVIYNIDGSRVPKCIESS